jgi:hypothetical protein
MRGGIAGLVIKVGRIFLQVYDVTPFVEEHPGGDAILNNAGGDSTVGFFGYFLCTLNSRL